ncbi:MAG: hypothetical protein ABIV51_05625 [Saprospiraceae bacterium]
MRYILILSIIIIMVAETNAQSSRYRNKVSIAFIATGSVAFKSEMSFKDFDIIFNQNAGGGIMANIEIQKHLTLRTGLRYGVKAYKIYRTPSFYGDYAYFDDYFTSNELAYNTRSMDLDLGIGYKWGYKRLELVPFASLTYQFYQKSASDSFGVKEVGTNNTRTYNNTLSGYHNSIGATIGCDGYFYFNRHSGLFFNGGFLFGGTNLKYSSDITDLLYEPSSKVIDFKMNQNGYFGSVGLFFAFGQSKM